jgi:hypothetical protein
MLINTVHTHLIIPSSPQSLPIQLRRIQWLQVELLQRLELQAFSIRPFLTFSCLLCLLSSSWQL